jgi:hypothetical protein
VLERAHVERLGAWLWPTRGIAFDQLDPLPTDAEFDCGSHTDGAGADHEDVGVERVCHRFFLLESRAVQPRIVS